MAAEEGRAAGGPAAPTDATALHTFEWAGECDDIYITGSFAQWGKRHRLERGPDGVFRAWPAASGSHW